MKSQSPVISDQWAAVRKVYRGARPGALRTGEASSSVSTVILECGDVSPLSKARTCPRTHTEAFP
jgi:hypothetical protein